MKMWIIDSNRMIWLYRDDIWYYEWKWNEWNEMDLIIPIVDIDKIVYSSWFYDSIWIWMKWDRIILIIVCYYVLTKVGLFPFLTNEPTMWYIHFSIGIDWNTSRIDQSLSSIENIYNHSLLSFYIFNQLFVF